MNEVLAPKEPGGWSVAAGSDGGSGIDDSTQELDKEQEKENTTIANPSWVQRCICFVAQQQNLNMVHW